MVTPRICLGYPRLDLPSRHRVFPDQNWGHPRIYQALKTGLDYPLTCSSGFPLSKKQGITLIDRETQLSYRACG
jgi:hypothetical protein